MEYNLDPTSIDSWPQAAVMIILIIAVLVAPSALTVLGNRRVKAVETSLTTNNGGSTTKDQLDRIERGQVELVQGQAALVERVTALENSQATPGESGA